MKNTLRIIEVRTMRVDMNKINFVDSLILMLEIAIYFPPAYHSNTPYCFIGNMRRNLYSEFA